MIRAPARFPTARTATATVPTGNTYDWTDPTAHNDSEDGSTGATRTRRLRLWVPNGIAYVRGLLVITNATESTSGYHTATDAQKAWAYAHDFAVLNTSNFRFFRSYPSAAYYDKTASFDYIATMAGITALATAASKPEINNAPFAVYGFSNGGQMGYAFAQVFPTRTIAACMNKGGFYCTPYATQAEINLVPVLCIAGQADNATGDNANQLVGDGTRRGNIQARYTAARQGWTAAGATALAADGVWDGSMWDPVPTIRTFTSGKIYTVSGGNATNGVQIGGPGVSGASCFVSVPSGVNIAACNGAPYSTQQGPGLFYFVDDGYGTTTITKVSDGFAYAGGGAPWAWFEEYATGHAAGWSEPTVLFFLAEVCKVRYPRPMGCVSGQPTLNSCNDDGNGVFIDHTQYATGYAPLSVPVGGMDDPSKSWVLNEAVARVVRGTASYKTDGTQSSNGKYLAVTTPGDGATVVNAVWTTASITVQAGVTDWTAIRLYNGAALVKTFAPGDILTATVFLTDAVNAVHAEIDRPGGTFTSNPALIVRGTTPS